MSYVVRLRRFNTTSQEWETAHEFDATPFVEPSIAYEHDDQEPPRVSASKVSWKVTARLYGAGIDAVNDAWQELRAAIESQTEPAQGVQLVHNDTVLEEISSEGGYDEVKIGSLTSPLSDPQWTSEMVAVLTISGTKRIVTDETGNGGNEAEISALTYSIRYAYDEVGFVTKTIEGELTVSSGSAEAAARTFGLELPSSRFAYVTKGPEGVDVEVLDRSDRKARFTSTIRESGEAIPAGVSAGWSVEIETRTVNGEDVTTTTVSAEGPGALDAVRSKRPSGKLEETIRKNDPRRTASAIYVTKKAATGAPIVKLHKFTTSGGGRRTIWSRRNGGRRPTKHFGALAEVVVDEDILLERTGTPELLFSGALIPPAIVSPELVEDTGSFQPTLPYRAEIGKDRSADKWQLVVRRRYTASTFYLAFLALSQAILNDLATPGTAGETLNDQALRIDQVRTQGAQ